MGYTQIILFKSGLHIEKGGKMKMAELLSLNVHPYTIIEWSSDINFCKQTLWEFHVK